jgi:predicted DNA-binding transcriptional regulator YafY
LEIEMKRRTAYDAEIAAMPAGLDRTVLRVLSYHTGRARAIGRGELVQQVGLVGCLATERQVRETIKQLRRQGYLICSAAGEDGGYFLADSLKEYDEFRQTEFAGKIADMAETMKAMDQAARRVFGDAMQPGLF